MKEECGNVWEVQKFLGACVFYCKWILHYVHISDLLYKLRRKVKPFLLTEEHTNAVKNLKECLAKALTLKQPNYTCPHSTQVQSGSDG